MKKNFYLLSNNLFVIILLFFLISIQSPAVSETASKFALLNERDELITLSKLLKNNNIIVAFWASYCIPCKKEIPQLVQLEKKYEKSKNIRLVLINADKEGKDKAMPVLEDLKISNECLFDLYQLTLQKYSPDMKIPATFIINRKGEILFKAFGENEDNIKNIEKAIKDIK